jgi:hypothetical protein
MTAQLAVCAGSVDQAIYTSSMASSIVTDCARPVCLRLGHRRPTFEWTASTRLPVHRRSCSG